MAEELQPLFYLWTSRTEMWPAGTSIRLSAPGGSLAPISAAITIPAAIDLLSPSVPAPGAAVVGDTTSGLTLRWLSAPQAVVEVRVSATFDPAPDNRVVSVRAFCYFDGGLGAGTVPASVVARMSHARGATLIISSVAIVHQTIGDLPVDFIASNVALGSNFVTR